MQRVLGRKQNIDNEKWLSVNSEIESLVSREDLSELVKSTVKEIKSMTRGKRAAYAWSAGKDSLVLGRLCEMAGIKQCVLVVSDLEYPAFMAWVEENKPEGLEIVNTGQDLEWLQKHPQMLFPQDSKTAAQWFHIVQHRGQARYYREHDLDMMLLGRRRADGNYVGSGSNIYTSAQRITRYSPLADWPHEAVLAFIHYYHVPVPPIYDWKNGYLCGTHPWPARQWTGSEENGWKEVCEIDRSIVEKASEFFQGAKDALEQAQET